jgi:hypothetical protein
MNGCDVLVEPKGSADNADEVENNPVIAHWKLSGDSVGAVGCTHTGGL